MTDKARQLGMKETNYPQCLGPARSAADHHGHRIWRCWRGIWPMTFRNIFPISALSGFNYKGAYYPTHDNLIGRYDGADGIKTGYTGACGFNLVSSVVRGGTHLIGVVMGGRTAVRRDLEMMHLLDQTFAQIGANPALVARAHRALAASGAERAAGRRGLQPAAGRALQFSWPVRGLVAGAATPCRATTKTPPRTSAPRTRISRSSMPKARPPSRPPQPAPQARQPAVPPIAAKAAAPAPAIRPSARPDGALASEQAALVKTAVNTVNAPRPQMRPSMREDAGEGDADVPPTPTPGHNWTIQIGAYADKALADAQLKTYATARRRTCWRAPTRSSRPSPRRAAICCTAPASACSPNRKRAMSARA